MSINLKTLRLIEKIPQFIKEITADSQEEYTTGDLHYFYGGVLSRNKLYAAVSNGTIKYTKRTGQAAGGKVTYFSKKDVLEYLRNILSESSKSKKMASPKSSTLECSSKERLLRAQKNLETFMPQYLTSHHLVVIGLFKDLQEVYSVRSMGSFNVKSTFDEYDRRKIIWKKEDVQAYIEQRLAAINEHTGIAESSVIEERKKVSLRIDERLTQENHMSTNQILNSISHKTNPQNLIEGVVNHFHETKSNIEIFTLFETRMTEERIYIPFHYEVNENIKIMWNPRNRNQEDYGLYLEINNVSKHFKNVESIVLCRMARHMPRFIELFKERITNALLGK